METWSFDILRQAGVDLWMLICIIASGLALLRVIAGRYWRNPGGMPYTLGAAGICAGTLLVLAVPSFHTSQIGLVWTLLTLAGAACIFYRSLAIQLGHRRAGLLLGLRLLAISLLVVMLFEPVVRYTSTRVPDRPLYLLVDTSGSMSVPDVQNGPSRIQSVWQALQGQLPALRRHFDVKVRAFGSEVKDLDRPEDLAHLPADGKSTDIARAISRVVGQATRKDATVVLISDGIDNTSPDLLSTIASSLRPIHTLCAGSEQTQSSAIQNVAVESIDADDELAVGHETKLTVTIRSTGLANRVIDLKWARLDENGRPQGETTTKKMVLEPLPSGQKVEFTFKPTTVGLQRIGAWIDPIPGERTTVDNRQEFQGLALDPRIKVLYVEGRLRPEYRELKRALDRDANIEAASLWRVQQDRFSATGSVDGQKLTGMPVTAAAWRKFDVVILGDLDSSFLTKSQQAAIEQAVSEGTGLLMIGGQSSFGPGSYAGTPIERALPVMVGGPDAPQEKAEFTPRLTSEGALHPAMDGLADWFGTGDKAGAKQLPPIRGNVVVQRPKQGAAVLLAHMGKRGPDGSPEIVLAVQQYGKGRSAAFTADTTYLWYLPLRGMGQESPYNRFWGQLTRWLAGADVKNRQQGSGLTGMLNKSVYQLGEVIDLKAMVRDERGDATRYADVQMELTNMAGAVVQRAKLTPAESHMGLYDLRVNQAGAGDYQVQLTAMKDGKKLGQQKLKLTVIAPADELVQLAAKPQALAEIARKTSGWSYALPELPQLVNQLVRTDPQGPTERQVVVPLANATRLVLAMAGRPASWATQYDLPMQAAIVLSVLMIEWLLRRKWQLT